MEEELFSTSNPKSQGFLTNYDPPCFCAREYGGRKSSERCWLQISIANMFVLLLKFAINQCYLDFCSEILLNFVTTSNEVSPPPRRFTDILLQRFLSSYPSCSNPST